MFLWPLALMVALALSSGCASDTDRDDAGDGDAGGLGDGDAGDRDGGGDDDDAGFADGGDDAGDGGDDGGRADASDDAGLGDSGDGSVDHPSIDDLPSCDIEEPDLACVEQLFLPLDGEQWPFDAEHAARAIGANRFYVAEQWMATAMHVLEADSMFPFGCFFDSFQYATDPSSPLSGPGCGQYLAAGGHPRAAECYEEHIALGNCVDQVPLNEAFDIAIVEAAEPADAYFTMLADAPSVGERVFLTGQPGFPWLSASEQAMLAARYPLVSSGVVLAVEGEAIVVSNLAFPGSSGGALLNARGRALGVASTVIGHMRAQGTEVPEELADHRTVIVGFTQAMSELLASANEP